ncbi:hypothetical protein [Massilibacteroides sp.]|uniref:hypothetical protein n=1 Tax=Massilibacteroides sp. TaxID=2034766 RepID=UPI0026352DBD|nr:hypothetical protein [Massilibacteroides sp.]MDD4516465.1 hypothetical protein [Massilibacteroides sp.]
MIKQYNIKEQLIPAQTRSGRNSDSKQQISGGVSVISGEGGAGGGVTNHSQLSGVVSIADVYADTARDIHLTAAEADRLKNLNIDEFDDRYLRKDIDDTAAGNITFLQSIHSKDFSITDQGWQINQNGDSWFDTTFIRDNIYSDTEANSFAHENGFKIWSDGDAWFRNLYTKKDAMFQGTLSSPFFVSGFPAGSGWALTWRDIVNAAGVAAKKAHFEIDDITVRGILRVYEMVISQLLGENGTHLTTDMMKIKSVDTENKIIYLDTEEGALYNPFWTDDIIMVQRFNGMPTPENDYYVTRQYEFAIEETHIGSLDDGEGRIDWIKYKNFTGNESDITERDTLVRVDNLSNADRKGVIKQTSVEPGSPYMDVVYGMKTDPDNAVRTRVGKLEGLITPYWGQLQDYGLMSDNAYLKGRFMLHNGDDVFQKFEIIEGRLESEISAIRAEISDADNCFTNSSFSSDLIAWETSSDINLYTVNSRFLYFNSNFYSYKNRLGAIIQDGGRKALRLKNNTIKQLNEYLKNKPEEQLELEDGTLVWPSYYISFRYKVVKAGTLTVGFSGQDLYHTEELDVNSAYEDKEYTGRWDGLSDFELSFTGDIYIYSLAMTSNPLEDFKIQFLTRISQTEKQILLQASAIQTIGNRVTTTEGNISVMAGNIELWASRVTSVEGRVLSVEHSTINVIPSQISAVSSRLTTAENGLQSVWNAGFITTPTAASLFASKDDVTAASITATINSAGQGVVKIAADRIELDGTAIIDIIQANNITTSKLTVTQGAKIGQFEVNASSGLTWKGFDYFGGTQFSLSLGTTSLETSTDVGGIIVAKSSTAQRTVCLAGIVSAFGIGVYGSSDGFGSNFPPLYTKWAGFFSGSTRTTGTTQTGIIAASEFRIVTSFNTDGSYSYFEGISFDPGAYDLDSVRFRVRKGLIVGVTNDSGSVLQGV